LELTSKAVEVQELEVLPWYASLVREIRDRIRPPQLPPLELTSKAVEVQELEVLPWYASLVWEIRDVLWSAKMPPLELTSKAVEVPDLWRDYRIRKSSVPVSLAIHGIAVVSLVAMQLAGAMHVDIATLDIASRAIFLALPPPPPAAPPPLAGPVAVTILVRPRPGELQFPVDRTLPEVSVAAPQPLPDLDLAVPGGIAGGVPGGVAGGMVGGVVGGVISQMLSQIPVAAPPPPHPVAANLPAAPVQPPEPAPPTPQRIEVSTEVQQGKLLVAIPPEYPPLARQARIQGTVRLEAVVATDGTLSQLNVLDGHPLLISAAIEAVTKWRYRPTLLNGTPVEVHTRIDVTFRLT
jgi:protein TonB